MKKYIVLVILFASNFQLFAQVYYDSIKFETPYPHILIDTSNHNIWQIGVPHKALFREAYSLNKAIVTDTLKPYPINNHSYFDLYLSKENFNSYGRNMFIEMKHKYDTDTLRDGGYISVSYDNGGTWVNIIDDLNTYWPVTPAWSDDNWNLYTHQDTLFNGEFGFSGRSDGWVTMVFSWHYIPLKRSEIVPGDTMILRFHFVSDSLETQKEGWMIDDIKLYAGYIGSGINHFKSLDFNIWPNPMAARCTIESSFLGNIELSILDVSGRQLRLENYNNAKIVNLERQNLPAGIYFVKLKTEDNYVGVKRLIIE